MARTREKVPQCQIAIVCLKEGPLGWKSDFASLHTLILIHQSSFITSRPGSGLHVSTLIDIFQLSVQSYLGMHGNNVTSSHIFLNHSLIHNDSSLVFIRNFPLTYTWDSSGVILV